MRVLIIDENAKKKLQGLKNHAEIHKFPIETLKKVITGDMSPAGDYPGHAIELDQGYRVVYSIEEQPIGWCHHLSVSVDTKGKLPTPEALQLIMDEFRIGKIHECLNIWIEQETNSINVLNTKDSSQ